MDADDGGCSRSSNSNSDSVEVGEAEARTGSASEGTSDLLSRSRDATLARASHAMSSPDSADETVAEPDLGSEPVGRDCELDVEITMEETGSKTPSTAVPSIHGIDVQLGPRSIGTATANTSKPDNARGSDDDDQSCEPIENTFRANLHSVVHGPGPGPVVSASLDTPPATQPMRPVTVTYQSEENLDQGEAPDYSQSCAESHAVDAVLVEQEENFIVTAEPNGQAELKELLENKCCQCILCFVVAAFVGAIAINVVLWSRQ